MPLGCMQGDLHALRGVRASRLQRRLPVNQTGRSGRSDVSDSERPRVEALRLQQPGEFRAIPRGCAASRRRHCVRGEDRERITSDQQRHGRCLQDDTTSSNDTMWTNNEDTLCLQDNHGRWSSQDDRGRWSSRQRRRLVFKTTTDVWTRQPRTLDQDDHGRVDKTTTDVGPTTTTRRGPTTTRRVQDQQRRLQDDPTCLQDDPRTLVFKTTRGNGGIQRAVRRRSLVRPPSERAGY